MSKHWLDLVFLHIKKEKILFSLCLIIIYLFGLPICINALNNSDLLGLSSDIICFNMMQKVLLPLVILIQSIFFRLYVDSQYKEIVFSLDRRKKWKYIFIFMIYIIILLLPFYFIIYAYSSAMREYLLIISFQILLATTLYYGIAMVTKSSLLSVGILLGYLFFFCFMYTEQSIINFLLLNISIDKVSNVYYSANLLVVFSVVLIGNYFEKKF